MQLRFSAEGSSTIKGERGWHMPKAPKRKRLNYNSVFDPGHAAILFPLKPNDNFLIRPQRDYPFDKFIESKICFQLLWRPSLVVRHIDLFNNVPLMRFMSSYEASTLSANDMLRVIAPNQGKFDEVFSDWAFDRRINQHFHHLGSQEQKDYDSACRLGKLKSVAQAEKWLKFKRYGLELELLLKEYQRWFKDKRD